MKKAAGKNSAGTTAAPDREFAIAFSAEILYVRLSRSHGAGKEADETDRPEKPRRNR